MGKKGNFLKLLSYFGAALGGYTTGRILSNKIKKLVEPRQQTAEETVLGQTEAPYLKKITPPTASRGIASYDDLTQLRTFLTNLRNKLAETKYDRNTYAKSRGSRFVEAVEETLHTVEGDRFKVRGVEVLGPGHEKFAGVNVVRIFAEQQEELLWKYIRTRWCSEKERNDAILKDILKHFQCSHEVFEVVDYYVNDYLAIQTGWSRYQNMPV